VVEMTQLQFADLFCKEWVQEEKEDALNVLLAACESIRTESIRHFLLDVFYDAELTMRFTNVSASLRHHHSYQGGLLDHVADMLWKLQTLIKYRNNQEQRDVLIAMVIVHDIGKCWTMNGGSYSALGFVQPHETMALEILAEPLRSVDRKNYALANLIRSIFKPKSWYPNTYFVVHKDLQFLDGWSARAN